MYQKSSIKTYFNMDTNSKFCVFYVKQIVFCPKHDIVISRFTETQFGDVVLSLKIYIFEFKFYTDNYVVIYIILRYFF